jgi:hypothetical protein
MLAVAVVLLTLQAVLEVREAVVLVVLAAVLQVLLVLPTLVVAVVADMEARVLQRLAAPA